MMKRLLGIALALLVVNASAAAAVDIYVVHWVADVQIADVNAGETVLAVIDMATESASQLQSDDGPVRGHVVFTVLKALAKGALKGAASLIHYLL